MNKGQFSQKWENNSKDPKIRPTYKVWNGMLRRCNIPEDPSYQDYGGRGITVCERWNSFDVFVADMGFAPKGLSIDRINNEQGYNPFNCVWATKKEQANNKRSNVRITYMGITKTITQWAEHFEIQVTRLHSRIRAGWSFERAINPKTYEAPHGGDRKYVTGCRCDLCVFMHKKRANERYRKKKLINKNPSKNLSNKKYDL